jgi:hypothetical protein
MDFYLVLSREVCLRSSRPHGCSMKHPLLAQNDALKAIYRAHSKHVEQLDGHPPPLLVERARHMPPLPIRRQNDMNFWNYFYSLCQKLHTFCLFLELSPRSPLLQVRSKNGRAQLAGVSKLVFVEPGLNFDDASTVGLSTNARCTMAGPFSAHGCGCT